jgi:membrane protein required for colicin V production
MEEAGTRSSLRGLTPRSHDLNALDTSIFALVGLLTLKGAVRGMVREVCGLLALAAGIGASFWFGPSLGAWLTASFGLDCTVTRAAAHGLLFLCPYVGLQAVGFVLHRVSRMLFLGGFGRAGGALVGGLTGCVLAGGASFFLAQTRWGKTWIVGSTLARPLAEAVRRAAGWETGLGL